MPMGSMVMEKGNMSVSVAMTDLGAQPEGAQQTNIATIQHEGGTDIGSADANGPNEKQHDHEDKITRGGTGDV